MSMTITSTLLKTCALGNGIEQLTLLDVRTSAEFEAAYIAGSHNLPLDQLQKDPSAVAALLPEDVILVCQSGARAGQAAQALAEAGAPHISVLNGASSPTRSAVATSLAANSAGPWNVRSEWSQEPWC